MNQDHFPNRVGTEIQRTSEMHAIINPMAVIRAINDITKVRFDWFSSKRLISLRSLQPVMDKKVESNIQASDRSELYTPHDILIP